MKAWVPSQYKVVSPGNRDSLHWQDDIFYSRWPPDVNCLYLEAIHFGHNIFVSSNFSAKMAMVCLSLKAKVVRICKYALAFHIIPQ